MFSTHIESQSELGLRGLFSSRAPTLETTAVAYSLSY
jgi:hypothetical protein